MYTTPSTKRQAPCLTTTLPIAMPRVLLNYYFSLKDENQITSHTIMYDKHCKEHLSYIIDKLGKVDFRINTDSMMNAYSRTESFFTLEKDTIKVQESQSSSPQFASLCLTIPITAGAEKISHRVKSIVFAIGL